MVERLKSRKPFRYREIRYRETTSIRTVGRRSLLNALADEYEFGDSLSKLYVSLLARALVAQDPKLLKAPDDSRRVRSRAAANLERCGVRL